MKRNRPLSLISISLLLSGALCLPALSQQKKESDVIRIETQLVQVDVLVNDKDNRPVKGLTREDFELYDNGKPQTITHFSFEEVKPIRVDEAAGSGSLSRVVMPGELNRVLAFVVDTLHVTPENMDRARKMLEDFVDKQMAEGDLALVFPTGGGSGLYSQFTSDQRILRGAISRLRSAFIFENDTPARRGLSQQVLDLLPALAETRQGVPQAEGQGGAGSTYSGVGGMIEESDVRTTISSLNYLVDSMSRLPGRKVALFISEGFRAIQTRLSDELGELTARAARANVVFYSIDPGGLDPVEFATSDTLGPNISKGPAALDPSLTPNSTGLALSTNRVDVNNPVPEKRRDYFESQDALNYLAAETGGRFYRNNNDIKAGLNNLLGENSSYYLLGFQPEKWDGKFHQLKVVVRNRPELNVITRRGYLASSPPPKRRGALTEKAAEIIEAINSPLIRRDIDLQLASFYRDDVKKQPVLTSLLHIDPAKLNFKQSGGKHKTKVEITGFMLDSTGRAADSFSQTVDLNLAPDVYKDLMKEGLLTVRASGVKPGPYQVKFLVREADSGLIGTASTYVEVPDFKMDRLLLSSIFTDMRILQQDKPGEITGVGSTLSQRRFRRGSQFAYVLIVYNARGDGKKNTQLEMTTRILKAGRVVYDGKSKPVEVLEGSAPPSRIITGGVMQLGQIEPGDYTLEVIVIDKLRKQEAAVSRQEIDFVVE
ncbi:MAG TPA: VWA domain-containing protein [Blastocatellia bacterium]|nr:VWA domain-containing protein [Blastocatellia bacterium]